MITDISVVTKHKGYANEHLEAQVTIDTERLIFEEYKIHTKNPEAIFVWSVNDEGFVDYAVQTPNHRGYGGAKITYTTAYGEVEFVGPWSSRASCLNEFFPHSTEVTIINSRGFRLAGNMLVSRLEAEGIVFNVDERLNGEIGYKVVEAAT